MSSSDKKYDDLTVIKGIASARQEWLREALNVVTFADLATLSFDEIKSQLKADKKVTSDDTIKTWIAEAQEYAATAEKAKKTTLSETGTEAEEQVSTLAEENEPMLQAAESAENESAEEDNASSGEGEWEWLAAFLVEFQVRKVEGQVKEHQIKVDQRQIDKKGTWLQDDKEKNSIVVEGEQLYPWMLEQVDDWTDQDPIEEEHPPQESATESVPIARSPVKVEIAQIRAFQPPQAKNPIGVGQADLPFEGFIKHNELFALEIHFGLAGEAAAELTEEPAVYNARAYVQDRSTGVNTHLGDTEPGTLERGELAYTATLPEVSLARGTYRLFALVTLQAASVKPDFVTLPVFTVKN